MKKDDVQAELRDRMIIVQNPMDLLSLPEAVQKIGSGRFFTGWKYMKQELQDFWNGGDMMKYPSDTISFEKLHDGSEGIFADLYEINDPYGIGKYQIKQEFQQNWRKNHGKNESYGS